MQPHRLKRYPRSTDPDFQEKAAEIIELYLAPPQHVAVVCGEKTAISAMGRRNRICRFSPGRSERYGFEYVRRDNALALRCARHPGGLVMGHPAARHTREEFVDFLEAIVVSQPVTPESHINADDLSVRPW